jgi:shikimate dehydrogenase
MNDSQAKRFALLGDPVAHSKSPAMHAAAYRALGLPHSYEAIRATQGELGDYVRALRDGRFDGLNVTIPHKRAIMDHVDTIDESARIADAANTIVRTEDGRIVAHNTDARALAADARRFIQYDRTLQHGQAIVLGSGGAARAAIVAFGVHWAIPNIVVRARSFDDESARAAFEGSIRETIAPSVTTIVASPWRADSAIDSRTRFIVQATSAGMEGKDEGDDVARVVDWGSIDRCNVAIDVVYAPTETPFLRAAAARGIPTSNGLGMLARQGALAFELWLGITAPLGAMQDAIR